MLAPTIMVQGTASSVGKSWLVTALCRFFRREGLRVAPFKSQNMALNSAVTRDGLEIGRAQAVQAEAAGLDATVEMNPILLKPEGGNRCQVVVLGKTVGSMPAFDYDAHHPELKAIIGDCLHTLRSRFDLVIIEGAGSPAEVNLKDRDLANMHVARVADAPVLLVGDIDRGGVFAAFVGTLELLLPDERERVAALVVNKFRGDVALLQPGLDFLTRRTGKPVLGVLPYLSKLRIADEDSVSLEERAPQRASGDQLDIAVVRLPRIANYDDVEALEHEPGVVVRFVDDAAALRGADLVILPGSKNTCLDLAWLRATAIAPIIEERARRGQPVLGICGGCQMLGERIEDPEGIESAEPSSVGLGLLPLRTRFARPKVTAQVRAVVRGDSFLTAECAGHELEGYEIHLGVVERTGPAVSPFEIVSRSGQAARLLDGAVDGSGSVVGTLLHGVLEDARLRQSLLCGLRRRRALAPAAHPPVATKDAAYDRLEATLRANIDCNLLRRIARV